MKKVFVSMMVITMLLVSMPFGGAYAANQDPFDLFMNNADMTVTESYSEIRFELKDKFYEYMMMSKDDDDKALGVFLDKLMKILSKNISVQSSSKIVLDTTRKDFGIKGKIAYNYGADKLIEAELASDFSKLCVGMPQVTDLNFGVKFNDIINSAFVLGESADIDLKPYFEILLKDDMPQSVKDRYTSMVTGFIKHGRLETLKPEDVSIAGKDYKLYPYKISLTYKDLFLLAQGMLSIFKGDVEAQDYLFAKMDEFFNHFIESGDYKLAGIEMDEKTLRDNYNLYVVQEREKIIERIDELNLIELYDDLEYELTQATNYEANNYGAKDPEVVENVLVEYDENVKVEKIEPEVNESVENPIKEALETVLSATVYLDEKGYARKYVYEAENRVIKTKSTTVFTAIGDEVEEINSILSDNVYYADLNLSEEENLKAFLNKAGGVDKVFDNISDNIIGGPAVKNLIADIIKAIKSTKGLKDKEEAIQTLENAVDMAKQQLEFVKMQYVNQE